ncbi:MAG: hypothetical protein ACUVUD_03510 [bacterium]
MPSRWLWVTIGGVTLVILFFLTRLLSQTPTTAARKFPELTRVDLNAYTRILGGVEIDTTLRATFSPELNRQLSSIDTMLARRELRDAIARLTKLLQKKEIKKDPLSQTVLYGYIGYSYNELAQPQVALAEFQKGLEQIRPLPGPTAARIAAWLAFNIGYLFQYYSYPESALFYYLQVERAFSNQQLPSSHLLGKTLNNLGVAAEYVGDTIKAKDAFLRAATYLDTNAWNGAEQKQSTAPSLPLKRNLGR